MPHKNLTSKNMPYFQRLQLTLRKSLGWCSRQWKPHWRSPTLSLPQSGPTGQKLELSEVGNLREVTCGVRKPQRPWRRQAVNSLIRLVFAQLFLGLTVLHRALFMMVWETSSQESGCRCFLERQWHEAGDRKVGARVLARKGQLSIPLWGLSCWTYHGPGNLTLLTEFPMLTSNLALGLGPLHKLPPHILSHSTTSEIRAKIWERLWNVNLRWSCSTHIQILNLNQATEENPPASFYKFLLSLPLPPFLLPPHLWPFWTPCLWPSWPSLLLLALPGPTGWSSGKSLHLSHRMQVNLGSASN